MVLDSVVFRVAPVQYVSWIALSSVVVVAVVFWLVEVVSLSLSVWTVQVSAVSVVPQSSV